MTRQAAEPVVLRTEEVDQRFALFDPQHRFARMFEGVRPLIDREADNVAEVFWDSMKRNSSVAAAIADRDYAQLVKETADGFRSQFVIDLDAAWCERISRHGDFCYDLEVPGMAAVSAIAEAYDHLLKAMLDDRTAAGAEHALIDFVRMSALEHELVLTRINDRQKRDERGRVRELAAQFKQRFAAAVDEVAELSQGVSEQSRLASENSRLLLQRSQDVLAAAQQCAQAMAIAARESAEMLQRMNGVADRLERSAGAASEAKAEANSHVALAAELSEATADFNGFTALIASIADRTRLLAFNAAIEAAHAGNAGRGFAVVADAVKNLATQASNASGDVGGRIGLMTNAVERSVDGNLALGRSIAKVADMVGEVRRDMDLQRVALTSITASIDETSLAVGEVSNLVDSIVEAAQITGNDMAAADRSLEDVRGRLAALQADAIEFLSRIDVEQTDVS